MTRILHKAVRIFVPLLLCGSLFASAGHVDAATIIKGPYLQNVSASSITVMWETDRTTASLLQFGDTISPKTKRVSGLATIHEVIIDGLKAETGHSYRVCADGKGSGWSQWDSFRTAPKPGTPFRMVVYGDNRTRSDAHARVIRSIRKSRPDVVVHTGDFVSKGRRYKDWGEQFFSPAKELLANVPVFPSIGNHDKGVWYKRFFSLPNNEEWYATTYGCARIIVLNSTAPIHPGSPQRIWLKKELASPTREAARWTIVSFHHPPFSSASKHPASQIMEDCLVPLFEKWQVDFVFCGHNHNYERSCKNGIHYIVTGGGGAGHSYFQKNPLAFNPYSLKRKRFYHHTTLDLSREACTYRAVGNDGLVSDSLNSREERPPRTVLMVPADGAQYAHPLPQMVLQANAPGATSVSFFDDQRLLGTSRQAPFSWTWPSASRGIHRVHAIATSPNGAQSVSGRASFVIGDYGKIPGIDKPPLIDGRFESTWKNAEAFEVCHKVGMIRSTKDLSAAFRAAWDQGHLYVFVAIQDDIRVVDSPGFKFGDDGVVLFLDARNDRDAARKDDDLNLVFYCDTPKVREVSGKPTSGIQFAQKDSAAGYTMEIAIPWKIIGRQPAVGDTIGFEFHALDDDKGRWREGKLVWWGWTDEMWPPRYGRLILGKDPKQE